MKECCMNFFKESSFFLDNLFKIDSNGLDENGFTIEEMLMSLSSSKIKLLFFLHVPHLIWSCSVRKIYSETFVFIEQDKFNIT